MGKFIYFIIYKFSIGIFLKSYGYLSFLSFTLISCSLLIFFSLFSFILAWTFISLQIKEFRIMGLSINDSVYSCVFFFLTGLHFFHLVVGLFLLSLLFWSCSLSSFLWFSALLLCYLVFLSFSFLFFFLPFRRI